MSSRSRAWVLVPLLGIVAISVAVLAAWAADAAAHRGKAMRNVTLVGVDVGGMDREALLDEVGDIADSFADTPVVVDADGTRFRTTAGELGVVVDRSRTVDELLSARREGNPLTRLTGWFSSFREEEPVGVSVTVVPAKADAWLEGTEGIERQQVQEPTFTDQDGQLVAVPGRIGVGIDSQSLASALRRIRYTGQPIAITVKSRELAPKYSLEDAQRLVDDAMRMTSKPIEVRAANAVTTIGVEQQRSWLRGTSGPKGLEVGLDEKLVAYDLAQVLAPGAVQPSNAKITLGANAQPVITPSTQGQACCGPEAVEVLRKAMEAGTGETVVLPTIPVDPPITTESIEALKIVEPVASFTTYHPCCASRVTNIHRMADLLRGTVILPGQTFSINQTIGPRTTAKGFVPGGAIVDGVFDEQVGGGISQFMTTLFNAAFFAGLDYGEYASHSIYISRYPYGREATANWPAPDLQIKNTTPYGVMLWPTYSGTSITVTLFSTKLFSNVAQTGQRKAKSGEACTLVVTQRTRTYLDGTKKVDSVRARYRDREGVNCDGTSSTTTVKR